MIHHQNTYFDIKLERNFSILFSQIIIQIDIDFSFLLGDTVKTAMRNFTLKEIVTKCPKELEKSIYTTAEVGPNKILIIAMGWYDNKTHSLISFCGTITERNSAKKQVDFNGNTFFKTMKT